jgi:outer membrane lipoprotein carrier protein
VGILRRSATAYANLRSLRADFVQSQENPLLGKRTESRGTISQRRPDRFLMKFSQPAGDVIVSDGEYFWLYYPSVDRKQVLRTRTAAAGGLDLQAQFIGDPTRRFTYTHHGRETVGSRAAELFTLVPKEPAGYRSLKVWLDQRDGLARRFELTNENGVVQHFELSNLELNPALPDALFRFVPPADARIVER